MNAVSPALRAVANRDARPLEVAIGGRRDSPPPAGTMPPAMPDGSPSPFAALSDPGRLATLAAYAVLDTPAEVDFDDVANLARQVCGTAVAFVTFVDGRRQFFKAAVGTGDDTEAGRHAPLEPGFCPLVVTHGRPLEIPDAAADPAHAANPAVVGPAGLRFYAGTPLVAPGGHVVGTLCVVDRVPRRLSAEQRSALDALGRQVVTVLQLRRQLAERAAVEASRSASDLRFRAAFDQMLMGMVETDFAGRVLQANAAFCRLVGRPVEQLLGRTSGEYTPADEQSRDHASVASLGDGRGDRFRYDKRYVRPDGTTVWARVTAATLRDADHRPVSIVAAVEDVTDRRAALAALTESRERFAQAVDGAGLGTFHWSLPATADTAYDWNATLKGFFWQPPDAVCGPTVRERTVHPDDLPKVSAGIAAAIATGGQYDEQYRLVGPAGQVRWVHARGQASGGEVAAGVPHTRFGGIVMDVTAARTAADAVAAALAEAERQSAVKDEFLATLGHELRTPLNAILGWSQILNGDLAAGGPAGLDPADLTDGLATIERNGRAQRQIIDDLLDMSRVISGKLRIEAGSVDLAGVLRSAIDTVAAAASAKGVRLVPVLSTDAGPVTGDANRLQQVLWNLLSNAVKFTPKGGRVRVTLERVDSAAHVTVSDTGEGIAAEFLPHVFERFRQADGGSTRRYGGLGLGLSIVKQLVELHGGTVRVSSDGPGRGATFTVALPVRVTAPAADDAGPRGSPRATTDEAADAASAAARPHLGGVRVLAVDDEPDARGLVRRALAGCGAEVQLASSAAEALAALARGPVPDVIVSDVGMPDADGYELIRQVRRLPAPARDVPAVALTAYARPADRVRALAAGFNLHTAKPVDPAELVVIVASLAGRTGR